MKLRKIALILVIVLLLSIFAAGCSRQTSTEQPAQGGAGQGGHFPGVEPLSPPVKVTVGMKQVVSDAGVLIGMAKGYYRELGIEIEPVQFNTGQDMINALGAGQLDVGCTVTASGLFNAMLRGIPIKIVADKGINVPGKGYYRLVIRKDLVDEIKDFKDLKGRKLAVVGTASLDEIALDRVLNMAGLTTRDVDLQVIRAFPDIVAAMSNKSIDGGMLIEPFIAAAVEKGIADPWKDPAEYDPEAQTALLVYGRSMIERPEVAKRFMLAYVKSLRDYNDAFFKNINKDEIISILAEYSVVKDKALYDKMFPVGLNPDGYVKMKGIQMDLEWYRKRGLLKGELKAEDVVDNSYVDYALSVLGRYK
ncbi:ABC transporter substrate-binding protein [Thermosediminibacter litoriperuensis]|uniref:NitT/TauT family transport system substrate-binding protein n=1 Tax=Thermosediminibacter litoriperuensis TaxID=291989 RepID=A0A5S5AJ25_9FIRM|nr:ABC transporter substrate-binding protein [Thermosediminibacter litoriperuensis]TYP50892.1 NitT/TauT family transport system substrate-binding protein [Thermosediminibacter litoriperuensis]